MSIESIKPANITLVSFNLVCKETGHPGSISIGQLILGIIRNAWHTCTSYFNTVELTKYDRSILQEKKWKVDHLQGVLPTLLRTRQLSPATVVAVCDKIMEKKDISMTRRFLFADRSYELPELEKNKLVFIPVVLEGLAVDHIIAVVFDAKNNRIEVFDPKGLTCNDYASTQVRCSEKGLKLSDVVKQVAIQYGNNSTVLWENTVEHQKDAHNCGVHVLDYFDLRSLGTDPVDIQRKPLSYEQANGIRRVVFARLLLSSPATPEGKKAEADLQVIAAKKFKHVEVNVADMDFENLADS